MAGIYIHIPFCKKACHYCDFHFSTSIQNQSTMVHSLLKEIELRKNYLDNEPIETIYFGGGTPSLLQEQELVSILATIRSRFSVNDNLEITLEANPDDLDQKKLIALKRAGINRLSIGIQSFQDQHLKWMNRSHTTNQAEKCIQSAQSLGFENITIDLIYGIPTLTLAEWQFNINKAIQLNIPHISAYNLTVEPKTALQYQIKKGITPPLNDEQGRQHLQMLTKSTIEAGYIQYEISNFGKPDFFSKHNTAYWQGKKYLGIGPSAHSFNLKERSWNTANNPKYIKALNNTTLPSIREALTNTDRFNEHIMLGLRNTWGCNWTLIDKWLSIKEKERLKKQIESWVSKGKMEVASDNEKFKLTSRGLYYADQIASDLFIVED